METKYCKVPELSEAWHKEFEAKQDADGPYSAEFVEELARHQVAFQTRKVQEALDSFWKTLELHTRKESQPARPDVVIPAEEPERYDPATLGIVFVNSFEVLLDWMKANDIPREMIRLGEELHVIGDYLHRRAAGQACTNIDNWFLSDALEIIARVDGMRDHSPEEMSLFIPCPTEYVSAE